MLDFDSLREIFSTIWMHKLRTAMTALVLIIGIFSLIFLFGMGRGLANGTMDVFGKFATNTMFVWAQRTTKPYMGLPTGRQAKLNNQDTQAIIANFPEVEFISPRLELGTTLVLSGENNGSFTVKGETPDLFNILPLEIEEGRFINQMDMKEQRKVCAIGKGARDILFKGRIKEAIGSYIKIKGVNFLVVGIQSSAQMGNEGREDEMSIIMPLSTGQMVFNQPNRVHYFTLACADDINSTEVEGRIKKMLRARHKIHPDDKSGINSFNLSNQVKKFTGLFGAIDGFILFVGMGFIIAGIAGIVNIMLIVVRERTREIGIRKSIGATSTSIMAMILTESVIITAVSSYIGLVFGVSVIAFIDFMVRNFGVESVFFSRPEVNFTLVFFAMFLMIFCGALAGLLPAYRAAKIDPVVALADE